MRDAVRRAGEIVGVRTAFGHSGPRDWAPDSTWFFDPKLSGGGALLDLGIHAIDFVRYVTGLEAGEVTAMTFGQESVEDAGHVIMRFDGGAVGYVNASWVARPAPDFALAVFGAEGTLRLDASRPPSFRSASGEKEELTLPPAASSPYEDFVRAVRGEDPAGPATPALGPDGRAAVAIVSAAYESARTGKKVPVA
jgi:predicted dehydrogenase